MNIASNGPKSSDIWSMIVPLPNLSVLEIFKEIRVKDDVLQECTCSCQFHCILCFVDLVGEGVGRSIPDP